MNESISLFYIDLCKDQVKPIETSVIDCLCLWAFAVLTENPEYHYNTQKDSHNKE
jgi:hypothetical protein